MKKRFGVIALAATRSGAILFPERMVSVAVLTASTRECVRIIFVPVEVDPARVTCEPDEEDLALRLPLTANALTFLKPAAV